MRTGGLTLHSIHRITTAGIVFMMAGFAISACGGSSKTVARNDPTPSADFLAAAEEAARNTVLLLEHAPSGWTAEPDDPAGDEEDDVPVSPECQYFNEIDEGFPRQSVFLNGDALTPQDAPGPEINSEASIFADEDVAREAFARYTDFFERCKDDYVSAVKTQAAAAPGFGRLDDYMLAELDVPGAADEVFGMRLSATFDAGDVVVDFVTVRQGRILATLAVGGDSAFDDDRRKYLEILSDRAAAANEALPEP
jgi:hypothetical protein